MKIDVSAAPVKKDPTFRRLATGQSITVTVDADDEFYVRDHDHKVYGVIAGESLPLVLNGGLRLSNRWTVETMRADSDQA